MSGDIDTSSETVGPAQSSAVTPFARWLREGARTAVFMRPRTEGLQAGPSTLLLLLMLLGLYAIGLQRCAID